MYLSKGAALQYGVPCATVGLSTTRAPLCGVGRFTLYRVGPYPPRNFFPYKSVFTRKLVVLHLTRSHTLDKHKISHLQLGMAKYGKAEVHAVDSAHIVRRLLHYSILSWFIYWLLDCLVLTGYSITVAFWFYLTVHTLHSRSPRCPRCDPPLPRGRPVVCARSARVDSRTVVSHTLSGSADRR